MNIKKLLLAAFPIFIVQFMFAANRPELIAATSQGGTRGAGVIFKNYAGDTSATPLFNLLYGSLTGDLTETSNGKLYGVIYNGTLVYLMEYDPSSNTYSNKVNLPAGYDGSLLLASDGKLYGDGFVYNAGDTFITPKGYYNVNGGKLIQSADGHLYGMNFNGNSGSGNIFRYDLSRGTDTVLYVLPTSANPFCNLVEKGIDTFYGLTKYDGLYSNGTIFRFIANTGMYTNLYDFPTNTPTGFLTLGSDGKLYGMTDNTGTYSGGSIFNFDLSTSTFNNVHDFGSTTDGTQPISSLFSASDGKLYGMTAGGGPSGSGSIFQYDPVTSTYAHKLFFNSALGNAPFYSYFMEYVPSITISRQPANAVVCAGASTSFSASATGAVSQQWQVSNNGGGTFTDIAGAIDTTYNFTVSRAQNNSRYRLIFSNGVKKDTSNTAILTVLSDSVSAHFTLQASSTPHLWYIVNHSYGQRLSYVWNWGDGGAVSTGDTPSHIYAAAGNYTICVSVTDSMGCSASYCDSNAYLYKTQAGQMVQVNVVSQLSTGINIISEASLIINSYNGAVHFSEALPASTQLWLYDLSGRVVMARDNFEGNKWEIPASLSEGIYIIRIQNDGYGLSKRIMVLDK